MSSINGQQRALFYLLRIKSFQLRLGFLFILVLIFAYSCHTGSTSTDNIPCSDPSCNEAATNANHDEHQVLYDPCANKSCGEICTLCPPESTGCTETSEVKACNTNQTCISRTPDLCNPSPNYDPCSEKSCGQSCTLCPPNDPNCFETQVVKACSSDGICVPDTEDLCNQHNICSQTALPQDDFIHDLPITMGCGDATLYAINSNATLEVSLTLSEICESAHQANTSIQQVHPLGDDMPILVLTMGQNVSDISCDDAVEDSMIVEHQFVATSGIVRITAIPVDQADEVSMPTKLTVTLTNAVFTDPDGCTTTITEFTWRDVLVGWFPG